MNSNHVLVLDHLPPTQFNTADLPIVSFTILFLFFFCLFQLYPWLSRSIVI